MAKNRKNGVQDLIGLERFTNYGVNTDRAEIVFFAVEPTNISVLSSSNIEVKVHDLTTVLSMIPDLEIIAMDSAERFDGNKWYVKERLQKEENPAVSELLQADHDFLDEIQLEMSSARRFLFAMRFRREKPEQIFGIISQVQKNISEHGFTVKRMDKADIKRMLALYFGTSIMGDEIPDIEGTNYIKEADTNEEKN
ncbi:MAG: hypothetical protein IKW87_12870 [Ruminococcus sp.]|nr:hypothetical protein [Ruminococcus sp.]